ncbi:MAG: alpha/beta fold hydrolase [Deltaproteobacteria bacterium]|nr:alpha/beta fold hydrolase [Deltaproteobacteria bacterium]
MSDRPDKEGPELQTPEKEPPAPDEVQPPVAGEVDPQTAKRVGTAMLGGLAMVGRSVARGALWLGRKSAQGYRAIDPDVRRHMAELPVLGLTMFSARDEDFVARADDGHPVLVFVHGLGGHRANFALMREALKLFGRTRSYSVSLGDSQDLDEVGARLREQIAVILEVNGLSDDPEVRVDLVAHSMGGVVSRVALEDPAFARRVRTLLTLGTPHRGTHIARFADTGRVRSLRPGSALFERLRAQSPWPGPPTMPRLVCVYSESDVVILPASTATLEGAESICLEGVTHAGFLLLPRVFARVHDALLGRGARDESEGV